MHKKTQGVTPIYMKRIYKFIGIGLALYISLFMGVLFYNNLIFANSHLGSLQSSAAQPSDFSISFLASGIESLLFFVCSGAVVLFFSLSRPEDKDFETKLFYLFPRINETEAGKKYCRESINKLACISSITKISISIDEYSEEYEAFRVSTDHEYHLLNLHNNVEFKDVLKVKYKLDDAEPGDFGNHAWGQIKRIRTISDHSEPDQSVALLDRPTLLDKSEFEHPFDITIGPNAHLILDISSWTWNKFKQPQNSRVGRFTEKLCMVIVNNSGIDLVIDTAKEEKDLLIGEAFSLHDEVATPIDKISYTIRKK